MLVRITSMILRVCALIALILGIIFWSTTIRGVWIPVHMLLGLIIVVCLWILGVVIAITRGGSVILGVIAIVLGILVLWLGLTQTSLLVGSSHWIIQVIHLLFGLLAIGVGEMISGRYRRATKTKTVAI